MAKAVRILTERDLLGDIGGGTPLARFTVTANGNVATDTTQLTITFTQNAASVTSDLTAAEITLSSGLAKGALTKVSDTVYTLAVTVTAAAAATVTINKPGQVVTTPVMVQVFKAPAGPPQEPAPGYWGVILPVTPGGTPHPARPTGAELQELLMTVNEMHVLNDASALKPTFTTIPLINADDWAATGATPTVWEATGRYFVLIREDVGTITNIVNATGTPQGNDFDQAYSGIVLNGATYNGWINNKQITIFDGSLQYVVHVS